MVRQQQVLIWGQQGHVAHRSRGSVRGSMWSLYTVARSNRQQLAPGEWRWTGHIHNLHKNVTGKRLTNHMDVCRGSPKDGLLYYTRPSDGFLKELSVHGCAFLARPTKRSKGIGCFCGLGWNMKSTWAFTFCSFLGSKFLVRLSNLHMLIVNEGDPLTL